MKECTWVLGVGVGGGWGMCRHCNGRHGDITPMKRALRTSIWRALALSTCTPTVVGHFERKDNQRKFGWVLKAKN